MKTVCACFPSMSFNLVIINMIIMHPVFGRSFNIYNFLPFPELAGGGPVIRVAT